jgi:hypothetical protein
MKTAAADSRNHLSENWTVILCLLYVVSVRPFFEIYRKVAFNTARRDDDALSLLLLIYHYGRRPGSPFGYRAFSAAPAAPLFWLMPLYKFSLLKGMDLTYLRATQTFQPCLFWLLSESSNLVSSRAIYAELR